MRLLVLGASAAQSPVIEAALAEGHEVFTADNVPSNPGHRLAHRSFPINAADAGECAELARGLRVDGVVGYASEVCARTAARVAHRLGLPGPPLAGVENLSNKAAFRRLQSSTAARTPHWIELGPDSGFPPARDFARRFLDRVVVKPVDSSGGRGIAILPGDLIAALESALAASATRRVIIEEFVPRVGGQIGGDGWVEDGALVFLHAFDNQTLPAPADNVAIEETFPSRRTDAELASLKSILEQCLRAAGYTHGPINFDAAFCGTDEILVYEIAPRNAGNRIPDIIRRRTGVDFPRLVIGQALDPEFRFVPPVGVPPSSPCHAIRVLAASSAGVFQGLRLHEDLQPFLLESHPFVEPGQPVRAFRNSGDSLGLLLLAFPDRDLMEHTMARMPDLARIELLPSIP